MALTSSKRLFLAIDLPQNLSFCLQKTLSLIRHQIETQSTPQDIRWIKSENLHITLKFLGTTPITLIPELLNLIQSSIQTIFPTEIQLNRMGFFPNIGPTRVLWIGIEDPENTLQGIYSVLTSSLITLGFPPERQTFVPHLTVGRMKMGQRIKDLIQPFETVFFGSMQIKNIILYESTLTNSGPIYKEICRIPLKQI